MQMIWTCKKLKISNTSHWTRDASKSKVLYPTINEGHRTPFEYLYPHDLLLVSICIALMVTGYTYDSTHQMWHSVHRFFGIDSRLFRIDNRLFRIDNRLFVIDNQLFAVNNLSFCHFWHSIVVSFMCLSSILAKSTPAWFRRSAGCSQ